MSDYGCNGDPASELQGLLATGAVGGALQQYISVSLGGWVGVGGSLHAGLWGVGCGCLPLQWVLISAAGRGARLCASLCVIMAADSYLLLNPLPPPEVSHSTVLPVHLLRRSLLAPLPSLVQANQG